MTSMNTGEVDILRILAYLGIILMDLFQIALAMNIRMNMLKYSRII